MASVLFAKDADSGEARFFFTMACVMAATIVGGFSLNIVLGRSSFAAPWLIHVHAVVFMGWVALYVAQNALVFGSNITLHRRLGWISILWLPLMVAVGLLAISSKMRTTGAVPFFDQNQFLFGAPSSLIAFAVLSAWAITVRRNTGWHRRLMFCGFAVLTGPGLGRLLPMPLLIPYAWWIGSVILPLLFPAIGMLAEKRRNGQVHPAWLWGIGLILGFQIVADLTAYSAWGISFTETFVSGTLGAERPMKAFFPTM